MRLTQRGCCASITMGGYGNPEGDSRRMHDTAELFSMVQENVQIVDLDQGTEGLYLVISTSPGEWGPELKRESGTPLAPIHRPSTP